MKRVRRSIFLVLFALLISACSVNNDVNIKSIEVLEESVPEYILAGKFDEAGIEALVTYDDNTSEKIKVDSKLLKDEYQDKLNNPGSYEIELLIKNKVVKLKVNIVDATLSHEVKFFNGFNEMISMQLVNDGESANEPSADVYSINGYEFIGWDRDFSNVKENINVYALYVKVSESGSSVDFSNILIKSANHMRGNDVNVLSILENSSKRIEETYFYQDGVLKEIVERVKEDTFVEYYRYSKELNGSSQLNVEEMLTDNGYYKTYVQEDNLAQKEIYANVKAILTSTDIIKSKLLMSNNEILHSLTATIPNRGDGNHQSDTYEFIYDENQIIYLKHYQNFLSSDACISSRLVKSSYYTLNPKSEEKVFFPKIVEDDDETENEAIVDIASKFQVGRIYSEAIVLETEHFRVELDANVYVPPYFEEYIEEIYDALEIVSGLKFYNEHYNSGKIVIEVEKPKKEDYPEMEFGNAYAHSKGATIHVSSGDLLLGNGYAISHELSHILMYSQSSWSYSRVLVEGFAEYNSYKAIKYLEKHNIEVAKSLVDTRSHISNMGLSGNIYSKSIQYWMENESESYDISFNGPYAVGFRLMAYLDSAYEDYSSWIHYYEQLNPYYINGNDVDQQVILKVQYDALYNTYGEDVLDGFYGWLKINEEFFASVWGNENDIYDLTEAEYLYLYPAFYSTSNYAQLAKFYRFSYDNLYISIDELRNYYQNYKGKEVSELKLLLSSEVEVELYDSNNNLLDKKVAKEFSLVNVSYIKLVGRGVLGTTSKSGLKVTL